MKKIIGITLLVIFIIVGSLYFYLRYDVLKAKDFKPNDAKSKNVLDLRPALIAKLKQLVKDGSDGLYVLSVDNLEADIVHSTVAATGVRIDVDTTAMLNLDKLRMLPDDIFKLSFSSLKVEGLGIEDMLNRKNINITSISLGSPMIKVYHKNRTYNSDTRLTNDTLTLYQKLKGNTNSIKIGEINISHGSFTGYEVGKKSTPTKFQDIGIRMQNLLIDSTTQFDKSRFLFARHVNISCNNYMYPTPDSLYLINVGSLAISGEAHKITAGNVEIKPRGNKQQFERKLKLRAEMYHLTIPQIVLTDVNWWAMVNHERFIAGQGDINGGTFYVYLDRSLPTAPKIKVDNFPQQMLMKIPIPVSIRKLRLHHLNISYEEYNPDIKRSATAVFDNINGVADNISNQLSDIKSSRYLSFSAKGIFMHKVPISAKFRLDLAKYKTGEFTADVHMDTLNKETVNPIAEPLSLFSVRKGQLQHADVHITGNNFKTQGKIAFQYTDLHITPLKKDSGDNGKLKKKTFTSLFANVFLIKNDNPHGGELRTPTFSVDRERHANFFNFIWVSALTGILKTIGIPVKLVIK